MFDVLSITEEYIVPEITDELEKLKTHFYRDERWYLTHDEIRLNLDEELSGIEIPDVIYHKEFMFFSDRLKSYLDSLGIDYIFYKKAVISDEVLGLEEVFWLVSIPRIDCINFEESNVQDIEDYDYNNGIVSYIRISMVLKSIL